MSERIRGVCFSLVLAVLAAISWGAAPAPPAAHNHAEMVSQAPATAADGFWTGLLKTYTPRSQCMNDENPVIWLNLISDAAIAISYYSIPLALIYFVRRRRDFTFHWLIVGFAAFILACGTTHVFNIIAIWNPVYRLDGIVKAITGVLSILTAIAIWPLIPKALAVPSPSSLRQANEKLQLANADAQKANLAKSQFLANMSHEIRTPMSAIIGYTDLIMDPRQTVSDRLAYINTIRRNGEHLLGIINGILDLSKIEAGKYSVNRTFCSPSQILGDVSSLMRVRAAEKNLDFFVRNEGPIPATIHTDPTSLRQILINLVGNAIKFTDVGSIEVVMRLEENGGKPRLRFDVSDTGIGITPDQSKRLFEPFAQADQSTTRRHGGTGLGLAISKRQVELLGGSITVVSNVGKGSTFTVTIDTGPLEGIATVKNWREDYVNVEVASVAPRKFLHGRVLLVEDWEVNRQLLTVFLRDAGLEVVTADNGVTGVKAAMDALAIGKPYDVILMDMQMPEMDGYEAASTLRSKGYTNPIVALTAHAMSDDRAKCLAAGCSDYLSKPVRREDLLVMVGHFVAEVSNPTPIRERPTLHSTATEDLKPLLHAYVQQLPEKVAMLEKLAMGAEPTRLLSVAHDLAGTGGMFGLMAITTAASKVESAVLSGKDREYVNIAVRELIEVLRSVEGYPAAPSKS
jgi:signal transduction histidine kinase/FixJ family two-component response regulator